MPPHTISKTLLASDPDQAQEQLEELSGALAAPDKAAGAQLRAVAVELVRRGLQVALVDYRDGWTELEASLPQAPHLGPVTLDRDTAGTTCQLAAPASIPAQVGQGRCHDARLRGSRPTLPAPGTGGARAAS